MHVSLRPWGIIFPIDHKLHMRIRSDEKRQHCFVNSHCNSRSLVKICWVSPELVLLSVWVTSFFFNDHIIVHANTLINETIKIPRFSHVLLVLSEFILYGNVLQIQGTITLHELFILSLVISPSKINLIFLSSRSQYFNEFDFVPFYSVTTIMV